MATKLKDIPFETLVPIMAPVDSILDYGPPNMNALLLDAPFVLARGCDGEPYDYLICKDRHFSGWWFSGGADLADYAGYADFACEADSAGHADSADFAYYTDSACEAEYAGYADFACEADRAVLASYADFACEADRAVLASYAECAGSAAGADYAAHAITTDQLGVSGANMYACGGELMVGGIDGHYGRLAVMSVSDLQGASPCTYVLVVEG